MNSPNYEVFRDILSGILVAKSDERPREPSKRKANKARRNNNSSSNNNVKATPVVKTEPIQRANPEDLAEFVDFLASEIFTHLPDTLQTLTYSTTQQDPSLRTDTYPTPLPTPLIDTLSSTLPSTVTETLTVYGLIPDSTDIPETLLSPLLNEYVSSVTAGPPIWASTRTEACEICERDWIPLSYHHLIPRAVHEKVRKRGWHEEWMLNSVAWLCRACHSFVHRMAGNEELAREWYTVERILEREDVQDWARWVSRIRWKKA
ncbi:HNH endonuclease [Aspergillus ruber CBS 135680]|uniref:Uncharacterized protein n=1 Tax=Aspergillus ruber (strain CBS 135680) TaxID=1388766 RepID=A0A017SSZ7_ASPRC|nr:uncharacterized protein EURHEDRAFT_398610 [Aspergillus ruber CBS 135680]EYE99415.1 hypothetical protein EURHEDRAFT_398610 [Aspergillus ruber CBS 135680]